MDFRENLSDSSELQLDYTVLDYIDRTVSVTSGMKSFTGKLDIPSTVTHEGVTYKVTTISSVAFMDCKSLTSVTIPDSVTAIEYAAFCGCDSLTDVSISDSVTSIGTSAFRNCKSLRMITLPPSVTTLGEGVFCGCVGLKNVIIPKSVTNITKDTFVGCRLVNVVIPDTVVSIGENAFAGCFGLTEIVISIPDSVITIGKRAFAGCGGITDVTFGKSVAAIGDEAFENCIGLTHVTIPGSVTTIGSSVFTGCRDLTDIKVSETNAKYKSIDGLLYNREGNVLVCYPCGKKGSAAIPGSVTTIGEEAFSGCAGLTEITIPHSVRAIRDKAFRGCERLKKIDLPSSVTEVSSATFADCSSLIEINVSKENMIYCSIDGVLYNKAVDTLICWPIGKRREVVLPESVTSIHPGAFGEDFMVRAMTVKSPVPPVFHVSGFFCGDTLNVPTGSEDLYRDSAPWCQFKTIIGVDFPDERTPENENSLKVEETELLNEGCEKVIIYDANGKVVMQSADAVISLETLPKGTYMATTASAFLKFER